MDRNNELKEIDIKICMCQHFNGIIKFDDFDLDQILIDEKTNKNILNV